MKNVTSFVETEKSVEMTLTISVPKKSGILPGSDFDLDKARTKGFEEMLNIIKAFSPKIIASLKRRMDACQSLLISHLEDVEYNDGRHICWRRKDGTSGNFNVISFVEMQNCIFALENSHFKDFPKNKAWVDQTLKALLNDPEQDHSDAKGYRYSQLVSILCELQACPTECLPK